MSLSPIEITTKGFGTMSLTGVPNPQPLEKSMEVLKYVKERYGVKFFNGSDFYQFDPKFSNLKLIADFLKSEGDVSDVIVSIKTGFNLATGTPDGSKEFLAGKVNEIKEIFKSLNPKPQILVEIARVDPKIPIEESITALLNHVKAGDFEGISLTEVSAKSISKAVSIAPISAIEVELSLFSQDIFHNGVLAEASKHEIPIVAYSPLSRGILTDFAAESDDFLSTIAAGDMRTYFDRFKPENFEKNKERLMKLYKFAKSKDLTLERLAISYLESLSGLENFKGIERVTRIVPIPSGSTQDKIDKNFNTVKLNREDLDTLQKIIDETEIHGYRYDAAHESLLYS